MKTQVAKKIMGQMAGEAMKGYFKGLTETAGRVGKAATQGALHYGRNVIAPGATTSQIPKLFRGISNLADKALTKSGIPKSDLWKYSESEEEPRPPNITLRMARAYAASDRSWRPVRRSS